MTSSTARHTDHLSVDHRELSSLVFSGGRYIAEFHQSRRNGLSPEERRANANLYVAAPDLLAELREVLSWAIVEKAPLRSQEIDSIRAAIAKATGAA